MMRAPPAAMGAAHQPGGLLPAACCGAPVWALLGLCTALTLVCALPLPQHLREELQQRINRLKDAVMAASSEANSKRNTLQQKLGDMARLQSLEAQVGG
jgi:hypothetical protein